MNKEYLRKYVKSLVFLYRCNTDESFVLTHEEMGVDKAKWGCQMCADTLDYLYNIFNTINTEMRILNLENEDLNSCMLKSDNMLRYIVLFSNGEGKDFYTFKSVFRCPTIGNKYKGKLMTKNVCVKTVDIITSFMGAYLQSRNNNFTNVLGKHNVTSYVMVLNSLCEIKGLKLIDL